MSFNANITIDNLQSYVQTDIPAYITMPVYLKESVKKIIM